MRLLQLTKPGKCGLNVEALHGVSLNISYLVFNFFTQISLSFLTKYEEKHIQNVKSISPDN